MKSRTSLIHPSGDAFAVNTSACFVLDAHSPGANIGWKSTAIRFSEPKGETLELAYLCHTATSGNDKILGTTRVAVPVSDWG